jgi:hypothetical protein
LGVGLGLGVTPHRIVLLRMGIAALPFLCTGEVGAVGFVRCFVYGSYWTASCNHMWPGQVLI